MSNPFLQLPLGSSCFLGYYSDKVNAPVDYLSSPSQNCLVNDDGKAESRLGYTDEFSIGVDGKPATAYYLKTYDVTFFALGTKVYYRDHTNLETYDTGITLTTGTKTRFAEFHGDIYLTNTTDGMTRICVGRLNDAAADSGDVTFTVDLNFLGRMTAFGDTTSVDIRINGTDEEAATFVVATGVCTHATTLSASYDDNSVIIFVDDAYSSLEKPSKITFWKSRMHIMGFPSAVDTDQPNNSVMAGQFVIGETGAAGMEKVIDFTYGTAGSTKIMVGGGGKVTNVLGVKDTIYFFTEDKVHATAASEVTTGVNETTFSTTAIGLTIPKEKDGNHGCVNEDCATEMGKNELAWITNDKRIMRRRISPETGSAEPYSDESFDSDIRDLLEDMDDDQTGAIAFHYKGQKKTIFQVKINGQFVWLIHDHTIQRTVGSTILQGAWQPPLYMPQVSSFFERNGVLWGTDSSDDSVYSFFTSFTDDLSGFHTIIATGEFNVGNAMMGRCEMQGEINQPAEIKARVYVTNENAGRRSGSIKYILGSDYTYAEDTSVGALPVGAGGSGAKTLTANWTRGFGIFPAQSTRTQLILDNEQEGGRISFTAYALTGTQYPTPFSAGL